MGWPKNIDREEDDGYGDHPIPFTAEDLNMEGMIKLVAAIFKQAIKEDRAFTRKGVLKKKDWWIYSAEAKFYLDSFGIDVDVLVDMA